jgi:hypothetical protein
MKTTNLCLIALAIMAVLACKKQEPDQKMLDVLDETKHKFYHYRNSFCPEAKLSFVDSILQITPKSDLEIHVRGAFERSNILLQLGDAQAAIQTLAPLLSDDRIPYGFLTGIKANLGMAYLRAGEISNCINNHGAEMCIFPISNGGVHKNMSGSKAAIALYEKMLAKNPDDLESRWLINIAYMTLGEYPQSVPKQYLISNLGQKDEYTIKPFEDIAMQTGLDTKDQAGGVIIEDFNNDGYVDVVTSSWNITKGHLHYFKNNGDGTFTDASDVSRLSKFTGGLNITQTDYNNDGLKDIFVARGAWMLGSFGEQPNSLLRNNGDGTFTDVTIEAGLLSFHPTQAITWNDFNNDGWLDLFIGNETSDDLVGHPCELYLNNKNGTFTEIAAKAKCNLTAFVKGVTSGDYDNDGRNDIFISAMNGRQVLLKNTLSKGQLSFEDVTAKAGLNDENHSTFPTWFWDYDNDGWLDIFICDYTFQTTLGVYAAKESLGKTEKFTGQPFLYHNNHDGTFSNVTKQIGLNKTAYAMGSNFGDIDNDGFLDIYLGTGNPNYQSLVPNKMFKNMAGKKFADVTTSGRVGSLQKGHGVAFADLDNDGDQDVFIEMGGAYEGDSYQNSLFKNPGQNNNSWLSLQLEGVQANKAAIGSKVKITFIENGKKRSVFRDVNSGGSFGSSPLKREIGLGQANVIDEIEIKWNGSGRTQKFTNIKVNQFLKLKEGDKTFTKVQLKPFYFKNKADKDLKICLNTAQNNAVTP